MSHAILQKTWQPFHLSNLLFLPHQQAYTNYTESTINASVCLEYLLAIFSTCLQEIGAWLTSPWNTSLPHPNNQKVVDKMCTCCDSASVLPAVTWHQLAHIHHARLQLISIIKRCLDMPKCNVSRLVQIVNSYFSLHRQQTKKEQGHLLP